MKRIFSLLTILLAAGPAFAQGWNQGPQGTRVSGSGTSSDPYIYETTTTNTVDNSTTQTSAFRHYKGYSGFDFMSNGMQQCATVEYYYYVNSNSSIALDFTAFDQGNMDEPHSYFRWYDYNTDQNTSRIKAKNSSYLKSVYDADDTSIDRGLYSNNSGGNYQYTTNFAVNYTPPTGKYADASWEGDDIACDVSRYTDIPYEGTMKIDTVTTSTDGSRQQYRGWGNSYYYIQRTTTTTITKTGTARYLIEPTLSIRFIYHIRPAKALAQDIMTAVCEELYEDATSMTYEDNKHIVFGHKDENSTLNLRVQLSKLSNYYFYPLTGSNKHVYYNDASYKIKSSDFTTTSIKQCATLQWRAYNKDKSKYCIFTSGQTKRVQSVSETMLTTATWYTLDERTTSTPSFSNGDHVYIVAYLVASDNSMCPVANYDLQLTDTYPKTKAQLQASGQIRLTSYLESHYTERVKLTYDDEDDTTAPTNDDNATNHAHHPDGFDFTSYSFLYYDLTGYNSQGYNSGGWSTQTFDHSDYCKFKSINLPFTNNTSKSYNGGDFWASSSPTLYDRTYELTNGAKYGYFLYTDASDESRQISQRDFTADFCPGMRVYFYACIADITTGGDRVQLMFHLYGLNKDADGNVTGQRLIQSFSSGAWNTNTDTQDELTWYQVYGKCILPTDQGVENFTDFRLTLDNMCASTSGADYAVDDVRFFVREAKVDVIQSAPVCPDETTDEEAPVDVQFKIRGSYESIKELAGTQQYVFYRFCKADGTPLEYDYDNDGNKEAYARVDIPETFDATKDNMETDEGVENLFILANKHFELEQGESYYVSVAYPDENGEPAAWGDPNEVCSTYSKVFKVVRQSLTVTDASGKILTNITVSCDDDNPIEYKMQGRITTVDPVNGGDVTLDGVTFDWFIGEKNATESGFNTISGLREAYDHFRQVYPSTSATLSSRASGVYTSADRTLLNQYKDRFVLGVTTMTNDDHAFEAGKYVISAIPLSSSYTSGNVTYELCAEPMDITLRVVEDGPYIDLGFSDTNYSTETSKDYRVVRIGLPQICMLVQYKNEDATSKGILSIPVNSVKKTSGKGSSTTATFTSDTEKAIMVSETNDPLWDHTNDHIADIIPSTLSEGEPLKIQFVDGVQELLREGYWYEANFTYFEQQTVGTTEMTCPGNTFFRFKIVPEYVTWTSSSDASTNWNNDACWMRSTAADIYKSDYKDYGTATFGNDAYTLADVTRMSEAFVPMRFSFVTIAQQAKGTYPYLSYISKNAAGMATDLKNTRGDKGTVDIEYDLCVEWDSNYESGTADGNFGCEKFYGNACRDIFFRNGAELQGQCYLDYHDAWIEKEYAPNTWYLSSFPLRDVYAGDLYVPRTGRQTTEAFQNIAFNTTDYSRTAYPFYQRAWDKSAKQVLADGSESEAYDYAGTGISGTLSEVTATDLQWSHVYNNAAEPYSHLAANGTGATGFSVKMGDKHYPKDQTTAALVRLPKADTQYDYYAPGSTTGDAQTATLDKADANRLIVAYDNTKNAKATITTTLTPNTSGDDNRFYLVGNPYTASLSAYRFLKANQHLEPQVWWMEDGVMQSQAVDVTATYDKNKDVRMIATQAFFVKLKEGETKSTVTFNAMMTTDRSVSAGDVRRKEAWNASKLTMSVNSSKGASLSRATIELNPAATADYEPTEDTELITSSLDAAPTVYTVAGTTATAWNTLPAVQWLPIGVTSDQTEDVRLSFDGQGSLLRTLCLYDAKERTYTPLASSLTLTVETNSHGRYFLTTEDGTTSVTPTFATSAIRAYTPAAGMLVVTASPAEPLSDVRLYDTAGRLVRQATPNAVSHTFRLAAGTYIVEARTPGDHKTEKIVVR